MSVERWVRVGIDGRPAVAGAKTVESSFDRVKRAATETEEKVNRFGSALSSFASKAMGLQGAVMGLSLAFSAKSILDSAAAFNAIERQLSLVTGSSKTAALEMKFLSDAAKRIGLDLQSSAAEFARWTVAARLAGMSAKETREIWLRVAEAGRVAGLTADSMQSVFVALQQMASKGKVMAQELRMQLGNALPGAFGLAAKAMGVTERELDKMMEKGELLAADLLPKLAKTLQETFGPKLEAATQGTGAHIARMTTAWTEFKLAVWGGGGKSVILGAIDGVAAAVTGLTKLVPTLTAAFRTLTVAAAAFVAVVAVGKIAAIGSAFNALMTVIALLYAAFTTATGAVTALTAAMAANPFGAIAVAVAAAAAGIYAFNKGIDDAAEKQRVLAIEAMAPVFSFEQQSRVMGKLTDTIIAETEAQIETFIAAGEAARAAGEKAGSGWTKFLGFLVGGTAKLRELAELEAQAGVNAEKAAAQRVKAWIVLSQARMAEKLEAEERARRTAEEKDFSKIDAAIQGDKLYSLQAQREEIEEALKLALARKAPEEKLNALYRQRKEVAEQLAKLSKGEAVDLDKLIGQVTQKLGADHPFKLMAEAQDGLKLLREVEAAGLRGTQAWIEALKLAIAAIEKYQAAVTAASGWSPDVNAPGAPAPLSEGEFLADALDLDAMMEEWAKQLDELEGHSARTAAQLRYQFGSVWEKYEMEVAEVGRLLREGAVDSVTAARMVRESWQAAAQEMTSSVEGVFGYLAEVAGGTFGKIAGYIANLARAAQGAQQFGGQLSKMGEGMGMSPSAAGTLGTVGMTFAFYRAIYDLGKQIVAERKSRRYSDGGQVGVTRGHLDWYGGSLKYGGQFAEQMKDLIRSIEDTLGGSFEQLAKISIKVRNDGKDVQAYVDGILIGKFNSVDEAIKAAFGRALRSSKLTGLDDLVAQGVAQLRYSNLDEAMEKLSALREIAELDFGDGLSSLLGTVQGLGKLWDVLAELREATPAVVAGFERIAAAEARAWQAARDSITGRERTQEEERAYREQQAKLFNAELALRKAELALKKFELEQEIEMLRRRVDIARTRGDVGLSEDRIRRGELTRQGELASAEMGMRSAYLSGLGALAVAEGEVRQQTLEVQKTAVEAQIELLEAQLAALEQLIAALPTEIDLGEIRLPDLGGAGGVGAGGDPLKDFTDEMARLRADLLPDVARQLYDLRAEWERLREAAIALGQSTAEVDEVFGEMLRRLQEDIRKPWQDILAGSGPAAELARIYREMVQGLEDYAAAGLDGNEVLAAATAQIAALRDSVLASLSPTHSLRQSIAGTAEQLDFLRGNFEALGLTAEEVAAVVAEVQLGNFLGLAERMAGYLDDQELLMELEQLRWELERANLRLQMDLLAEAGLLSQEQYDRLLAIWERLPETAPEGFSRRGRSSGRSGDSTFGDAVDRFRRATERLIEFQKDLLLGDQSALSPEEKFLEAQRRYNETYQAALGGDVEARERFEEAARDYLAAARDFFASSESYALVFEQIRRALEVLIGVPAPGGSTGHTGGVIPLGGGTGNAPMGGYGRFGNLPPGYVPRSGGTGDGRLAEEMRITGQVTAQGNEALRREVEALRLAQAAQLDEIRRLNASLGRRTAPAPRRSAA